jgi:hypothetical protein
MMALIAAHACNFLRIFAFILNFIKSFTRGKKIFLSGKARNSHELEGLRRLLPSPLRGAYA